MQEGKKGVNSWVIYLNQVDLPVLRKTALEIERLRKIEDRLTGRDLSSVILHDAMMTIKVLRYLESRRKSETEITTISHAIMMMGTSAFFEHFRDLSVIEDRLEQNPVALQGMLSVMSRSRQAALYAQDWSILRRDFESDEVTIAALLHDMAEMLLWCYAPKQALEIRRMMMRDPSLRSSEAQQAELGFELSKLQLLLAGVWRLPKLLRSLMDTTHAANPRVLNVNLATALARHSALGWHNAALPDDYDSIQEFLGVGSDELAANVNHISLVAARDWNWYGIRPSAAWLPMLPGLWPVE